MMMGLYEGLFIGIFIVIGLAILPLIFFLLHLQSLLSKCKSLGKKRQIWQFFAGKRRYIAGSGVYESG